MDSLVHLIAQADSFHPPGIADPRRAWYKEWHHFCVLGAEVQAILNLNLSSDTRPAASPEAQLARVVLLTHEHVWDGDIDTIPAGDTVVHAGSPDVRFGQNTIRFQEGAFHISVAL